MTEPLKGGAHLEDSDPPERLRARLLEDEDIEYLLAGTDEDEDEDDTEDDDDAAE